jgi:hypothetical protein
VCWVDEERILVADTDNHLLRLVNLAQGTVTTVGGTGKEKNNIRMLGGKISLQSIVSEKKPQTNKLFHYCPQVRTSITRLLRKFCVAVWFLKTFWVVLCHNWSRTCSAF